MWGGGFANHRSRFSTLFSAGNTQEAKLLDCRSRFLDENLAFSKQNFHLLMIVLVPEENFLQQPFNNKGKEPKSKPYQENNQV